MPHDIEFPVGCRELACWVRRIPLSPSWRGQPRDRWLLGVDKYLLIVHGGTEEVEQTWQIFERTEAVETAIYKA